MPETAETTNYMILGLAVVFIPMMIHIYSIWSRYQNLKRDQDLLKELDE